MKALLFALPVLFVTVSSFATNDLDTVKQAIAGHMDAILSDTVNEGDGSAYVSETDGKPDVDCAERSSKSAPNKKLYFCNVGFDVKLSSESDLESRNCRLAYSVINDDLKTLQEVGDLEMMCIENLASE